MEEPAAFTPVVKGQVFANSKDVTKAIQRTFLHGRTDCASTGGGGCSKVFRCSGEGVSMDVRV